MERVVKCCVVAVLAAVLALPWLRRGPPSPHRLLRDVPVPDHLLRLSREMATPQVIRVTDGVHVAINFALGNSILLEGPTGNVIVDTTESLEAAEVIAAKFREISDKPVRAIIYTHHHADHVTGSKAFFTDPDHPPAIIGHHLMQRELEKIQLTGRIHGRRAMFQFGNYLRDYVENSGIGLRLRVNLDTYNFQKPSQYITEEEYELHVAGLDLTLVHIPGETSDQLGVWLADRRVFLAADDIYQCFPNLYAIRGTTPRDVTDWVTSLHTIRKLRPRILVGSHHKPIYGEENVYNILTVYKAGIQLVHDQTVRFINTGMHPDEIVKRVKLLPELAEHSYMRECYGTVHWSVKGIYVSYMGWFSGFAEELSPLAPSDRAARMLRLVGRRHLLGAASDALRAADPQWALELASHVYISNRGDAEAISIRRDAMKQLAAQQSSANGRNYYLTSVLEDLDLLPEMDVRKLAKSFPMSQIFNALRVRLKAEDTVGVDKTACFNFTDTEETFWLHVHHGVLEVSQGSERRAELTLTTTEAAWREVLAGNQAPLTAYLAGAFSVDGGLLAFRDFMGLFDQTT